MANCRMAETQDAYVALKKEMSAGIQLKKCYDLRYIGWISY